MTVAELIEALSQLPQDSMVLSVALSSKGETIMDEVVSVNINGNAVQLETEEWVRSINE